MREEYEEMIVKLMKAARTDELTQCGNYRAFREYLHLLVQGGASFSVVLFDMTNLKAANEELGHFGADMVLNRVGNVIRSGWDHAFRHGGDEFAVVLPGAHEGGATAVRDRIEEEVGEDFLRCGSVLRVVGAVAFYRPGLQLEHALNGADKVLEARKRAIKEQRSNPC